MVDFLIEAEEDEKNGQGNPVPLESIRAENVLIQSKQPHVRGEGNNEVIEHVWIMSSLGENSDTGTVMARLCAVGNVLYELFAGEEYKLTLEDGMPNHDGDGSAVTVECIDLDGEDDNRPRKRSSQMKSTYSEDRYSNCIARLASKGFPSSVRALVNNLMGCGQGDHCDDDAYTSFHDLRTDLRLMLDDPSRFLVDIQVSNGLPTLEICDKLYGRESEEVKAQSIIPTTHQCKRAQRSDHLRRGWGREITPSHAHPKANVQGKWILLYGQISAKQHACKAIINDWGTV